MYIFVYFNCYKLLFYKTIGQISVLFILVIRMVRIFWRMLKVSKWVILISPGLSPKWRHNHVNNWILLANKIVQTITKWTVFTKFEGNPSKLRLVECRYIIIIMESVYHDHMNFPSLFSIAPHRQDIQYRVWLKR